MAYILKHFDTPLPKFNASAEPGGSEAEIALFFMKSKFCRFLLSQAMSSQDISRDKFHFVPSLSRKRKFIDSELYKTYKLTEDEIDFIESMIRPMDAEGDGNGKQ